MARSDITDDAILLLKAIEETKGRFGFSLPIEVLLGRNNARVKKGNFDKLESFHRGAHRNEEYWKTVGRSLVQELLVDGRRLGGKGKGKGNSSMQIYSVSCLGKQVLSGQGNRVNADFAADAASMQQETALRAARAAKRRPPASPTSGNRGAGDTSSKQIKQRKIQSPPSTSAPSVVPASASIENGLRPPPNPQALPSLTPIPPGLDAALMPFQRAGVAFAIRRAGRVLIGDDMGLGKTIQAIAVCCAFRDDWPALIVVPCSVRNVWADELERWIPDLGPVGVNVIKNGNDLQGLTEGIASFHIITYDLLARASRVRDFLRDQRPCKILVADESHMLKNRSAQRTREVLQITRACARVMLLSGTPALARPLELYTQIDAIEPGLFPSYTAFTNRYCAPKWTPFGMDFNGASNLQELHARLCPIMVRRLKSEVLTELPAKRRQRIQLEIDDASLQACASLKDELQALGEEDPLGRNSALMKMYMETAEAKMPAVCEYVEDLLNGGCKFLVFAHHLKMLDAIEAAAVKSNVKYIRIDGSVNPSERLRRVDSFQTDDSCRVAILGLMAAGVGITLTAASTVVFAELHWTPGILVQAEDRAHRIGQKASVNIHYLVADGTIDDIIWPSVAHKVEVVSAMCDGRTDHLVAAQSSADKAKGSVIGAAQAIDVDDLRDLIAAVEKVPRDSEPMITGEKPIPQPPQGSVLSILHGEKIAPKAPAHDEEHDLYAFCVARITRRLHVLYADGRPFGCNLKLTDWNALSDDAALPSALRDSPTAARATRAFLQQWSALKSSEQRHVAQQASLNLPLSQHVLKKPSPKKRSSAKSERSKPTAELRQEAARSLAGLLAKGASAKQDYTKAIDISGLEEDDVIQVL